MKGFQKVFLQPGETQEVTFTIDQQSLSFYDDKAQEWKAEPGTFKVVIAASATDIRSTVEFEYR